MENILIAGANGTTGREVVAVLKDHPDYDPIAMVRKEDQQAYFDNMEVKSTIADLEGDLTQVVKGIDRIVFAAGSGGNTSDEKTKLVDRDGAINLVDQAKAAGVRKFVMLSAMGTESPEKFDALQEYMRSKKIADDHLKASFLEYSIVKPGALTNDSGTGKIKAKKRLNQSGSIPRRDVARVLVDCLPANMMQNQDFEILSGDRSIALALEDIEQ